LCPLIKASGEQPRKIHIILKAKNGNNIRKKEGHLWDPDVVVYFNDKAWQRGNTWQSITKDFDLRPGSILFLDRFSVHLDEEVIKQLKARGITVWFGPPGTTDYWQPVDCGVGTI